MSLAVARRRMRFTRLKMSLLKSSFLPIFHTLMPSLIILSRTTTSTSSSSMGWRFFAKSAILWLSHFSTDAPELPTSRGPPAS